MTGAYALRDSSTMLRRNLRHLQRYPGLSLFPILMPVVFLLLFVYVFGDTLGNGITTGGGRGAYINFLTPGMLVFTIAVALLIGYHSAANPMRWLAALGMLTLLAITLTWPSVALGLVARSVETASNIPMFLILLPFLGSGFVPVGSMPASLRWFAENQPFTPITNTVRDLLANQYVGRAGITAVAWCLVITAAAYLWARHPLQPPARHLTPPRQSSRGTRESVGGSDVPALWAGGPSRT
jgi:ABC-2 type transport system permease protein